MGGGTTADVAGTCICLHPLETVQQDEARQIHTSLKVLLSQLRESERLWSLTSTAVPPLWRLKGCTAALPVRGRREVVGS
ncbi:hypothetical protein F2Q70_00011520 [Brassica cretica]|uniref:Uncharacterized protein n=1 Tax=Brassica cretica TaxID=69181 RepID=A0A8S9M6R1_BRACR|nr:hypothetical protein F2Q70_00011520 [Brassica cretica]KAF3547034.1 hypothetical protein DY000_02006851 [Brassica cretica]